MAPYFKGLSAIVALLVLSTTTLAIPNAEPYGHPAPTTTPTSANTSFLNCATKTVTTTPATCPKPTTTTGCVEPDCILLSTIHLNCDCPTPGLVFTETSYVPCTQTCREGCGIAYQTEATPCPVSAPSATTTTTKKKGGY